MSQLITQSQTANKNAPIKKLSLQEYREKSKNFLYKNTEKKCTEKIT